MKQLLKKLILLFGFSVGLFLYGCSTPQKIPQPNPTPQQILIKTVKATNWLATIGIIGMGLGVFAFFSGNTKFGIAGTIACFIVLSVSLAVARYHETLALYCIITATVGTMGMFAYTIFVKNRALKEIITGIQNFKDDLKKKGGIKPTIFAPPDVIISELKTVLSNQTDSTQELVAKIKEKP